jgi:hypothetical protein
MSERASDLEQSAEENIWTKMGEIIGGWRKLRNEELHNSYSTQSVIRIIESRRMNWAGHVTRMGDKGNAYRILVGKPEGKRPLGRPRTRWVDNIKMDLKKMSTIFWDITPCSPLKVNRRFGGTYRLHIRGRILSRAKKQREDGGDMFLRNVG